MKILALINKDEEIRKNSSSGGVFYLLAREVINSGGVVFGVKFDENSEAVHGYAETLEDTRAFMTSKYVQSYVGTAYKDAEKFLKEGRYVLFTGTPCQVAALKKYLGADYERLITLDFICHGVPSRRVWREYIGELSRGKEIASVNFRDKTEGWRVFSLRVDFKDGSTYRKNLETDIYTKGFLKNLYLRPSCYDCKFRGVDRVSDITIADFWGVQNEMPKLFDDKGTSLAIVRNDEVLALFEKNMETLVTEEISEDVVRRTNHALEHSCKPHKAREEFFKSDYKSIRKHINGFVKDPVSVTFKKKLYKIKKKLMG